jgi:hypothetical protein
MRRHSSVKNNAEKIGIFKKDYKNMLVKLATKYFVDLPDPIKYSSSLRRKQGENIHTWRNS